MKGVPAFLGFPPVCLTFERSIPNRETVRRLKNSPDPHFPRGNVSFSGVARTLLSDYFVPQRSPTGGTRKRKSKVMKKFFLGLIAVAAVLLPMSQNAEAHWVGYHHYWGHYGYVHHRYWHGGHWYGGYWHPGYWYPAPVIVIGP